VPMWPTERDRASVQLGATHVGRLAPDPALSSAADVARHHGASLDGSDPRWHFMRVATYQQTLRRLQPIVPVVFDALQAGLAVSVEDHVRKKIRRKADPHYFSHVARRITCEELRSVGLLVTDPEHERSALPMSSIQIDHAGARLWVLRASNGEIPLPLSPRKQAFYRQEPTLEGWDNLLLLWDDDDGVLKDPMHLVRPLGCDGVRRNLRLDWEGPLSRHMATLRAEDLDQLQPEQDWRTLGGDNSA
jgi:hypothetical protein